MPPLLLGHQDGVGGSPASFALDDDEADDGDAGGDYADESLLAALDDRGRLFVGKRGGVRVLIFDASSGASLGVIDAPRLKALTALLAGHVAIHADGSIFVFNQRMDIAAEVCHDLLDDVVRMSYDPANGRLLCLTNDSAASDDDDGTETCIIAVNIATPSMLAVLLPHGIVTGNTYEFEGRADRERAAAALAAENERVTAERSTRVMARMNDSGEWGGPPSGGSGGGSSNSGGSDATPLAAQAVPARSIAPEELEARKALRKAAKQLRKLEATEVRSSEETFSPLPCVLFLPFTKCRKLW